MSHLYACGKLARFACAGRFKPLHHGTRLSTRQSAPRHECAHTRSLCAILCLLVAPPEDNADVLRWLHDSQLLYACAPAWRGPAKPHLDVFARYPPSFREDHPKVQVYFGQAP